MASMMHASIDLKSGKGPQSYIASLQDDQIDSYDKVVALLTLQYDNHYEPISATTVASQLRMLKQNG